MAIVSAEVRFAPKLTAWFTANPTKVLQDGEIVYCSDGANIGKYVIGDNSTALSALTFYGGVSSSGLTIASTTITGGTNTNILYNNNGVLGEYTLTGTGTAVAMGTSPVFTTDITTPLIIGGSAVGSTIQYKGTTGNGTSTVAAHQFLVGNNGATSAMSIYNSGVVNIGNAVTTNQLLVRIGQDTAVGDFGSMIGGTGNFALYVNNTSTAPDANNWVFSSDRTTLTALNNAGSIALRIGNNDRLGVTNTGITFSTAASGSGTAYSFTCPASSGVTALTNRPYFLVAGAQKTWNSGTVPLQYFNWFTSNTTAASSASNFTVVANLVADYVQGGTNATNVTSAAIYVPTLALTNTTTSYGILVNAATGASTNHALGVVGTSTFSGQATFNSFVSVGSTLFASLSSASWIIQNAGAAGSVLIQSRQTGGTYNNFYFHKDGGLHIGAATDPLAWFKIAASTTALPHIFLVAGVAPTGASLSDGALWFDGTDVKMRIGGVTKTFTLT